MTKDELQNKILDDMTNEYYGSNLCQMIDNHEMMSSFGRTEMENAVFEMLDDLAHSVIDTMEDNNVLVVRKAIPA